MATTTTLYQSIEPEIKDISRLAKGTFNYGGFFSSSSSSVGANAQPEIRELGERVFSQIRAVARHTNEREWFSENEVSEGFLLLLLLLLYRFCVLTRWFLRARRAHRLPALRLGFFLARFVAFARFFFFFFFFFFIVLFVV